MSDTIRSLGALDRVIHEPARLMIMALLSAVDRADFLYLLHETGLTKGNLNAHLARLEQANYIEVHKTFRGKVPQTLYRLTPQGLTALQAYRVQLQEFVGYLAGTPQPDAL